MTEEHKHEVKRVLGTLVAIYRLLDVEKQHELLNRIRDVCEETGKWVQSSTEGIELRAKMLPCSDDEVQLEVDERDYDYLYGLRPWHTDEDGAVYCIAPVWCGKLEKYAKQRLYLDHAVSAMHQYPISKKEKE